MHRIGIHRLGRTMPMLAAALLWAGCAIGPAIAQPPLTDPEIANAVDDALLDDPAAPAGDIDVAVSQGIVTLSGSVNNILAKDRAEQIAATVKGVRGVVNQIDVHALPRPDNVLAEDVEAALQANAATESWQITVSADDGVVTLDGTLDSWKERELAARAAKGVKGVRALNNAVRVASKTDRTAGEIREEIRQALRWDAYVDDALVEVDVDPDRVVTLAGTVGSYAEKVEAGAEAWVAGVTRIENNLQVEGWAREERFRKGKYVPMTAAEIRDAVNDALLYDPRVYSFEIDVSVDSGRVTLRGTVDSPRARRAAGEDARNVVGVWSVDNRIKVRPAQLSDREVRDRVQQALVRDPYVERYELTVSVKDRIVNLYGAVDSTFEKVRADEVAASQAGVRRVNNFLMVNQPGPATAEPYVDDWKAEDYRWYDRRSLKSGRTDWEIREQIEDEFYWSPFVDRDEVHLTVEDGVAELTGTVDTWQDRRAAEIDALQGGAVRVDNDLKVEYGPDYYQPE